MAQVDSIPRGHPGPLTPQSQDELDKELDWLIENGSEENQTPRENSSNLATPRSPRSTEGRDGNEDNLRKMDTHYPRTPSPRSASPGSPPPSSPSHIHYADDVLGQVDDDINSQNEPASVEEENNHKKSSDEDDDNYEDDYELSEDQKQAMMELQEMKIDLGYTEEDPPEYDVTERVRQLNEELANDPTPGLEDSRKRAIKFPENVVSQEIPPLDYTESEESDENQNKGQKQEPTTATNEKQDLKTNTDENKMDEGENNKQSNLVAPIYTNDSDSNNSDNEDNNNKNTASIKKESTKTEIGDEVVDSDQEDLGIKDDDKSSKSSLSDHNDSDSNEPQSVGGDKQTNGKTRPKSSAPAAARMRFKQTGAEIKKVDSDQESNSSSKNTPKPKKAEEEDEERVLVERNGEFELLKASDLTPEERQFYGVETEEDKDELKKKQEKDNNAADDDKAESVKSGSSKASSHSSNSKQFKPQPPRGPRPYTATDTGNRRATTAKPRAQSAKHQNTEADFDFDYTSPYAMTPEERRAYKKEENERKKGEKQEEEEKRKKKEREKDEAEEAFEAWLRCKRQDASKRREHENQDKKKQKEKEENDDENDDSSEKSNVRDPKSAYKEWCQTKKEDQKKNRKVEEAKRREYEGGYSPRARKVCNKAFNESKDTDSRHELKLDLYSDSEKTASQLAFKAWLKSKNSALRRQKLEEQSKNRVSRLLSRRSRKSQQLARAMTHANAFNYVDYYGYRY